MTLKIKKEKSIKALRNKAWILFSSYIRQKEKGLCFTCGKKDEWKSMNAGHFVHKDCLDYNEKNVHCQCPGCNQYKSGNLVNYAIHLEKIYGFGIVQELKKEGDKIKYWKIKELEETIETYKNKLKELN